MFPTPATVRWSRMAALIGALRPASRAPRLRARYDSSSGSVADTRVEVWIELARLEQQPRAEPPDVAIGDVRSVV